MRSPQSENSSSPRVHSRNLQRELTKLIDHVEADTQRVDDPRFRGLLEKSAEILKGLRTLFERYGKGSTANADSRSRRTKRSTKGSARTTSSRAGGGADSQAKRRPTNPPQGVVGDANTIQDENQKAGPDESNGNANATAPIVPIAHPKPVDPDEVAARMQQQRKEARAPKMPGGHSAPKPLPPRSGKPVWSKPHSA